MMSLTFWVISIIIFTAFYDVFPLPIPESDELGNKEDVSSYIPHRRAKREIYVTFQDRAQSICIGMCMYHEKKPYARCSRHCKIGRLPDPERHLKRNKNKNKNVPAVVA